MVRNPLEVAHSMRKRNGSSYSFGLRLWEIYNRRLIEAVNGKQRLVTHYDLFFQEPEFELRRITDFIGLPDVQVASAAALVTTRRRNTHFTVEQLIDARVAPEVIELYRGLIAEASRTRDGKASMANARQATKQNEPNLLPGRVTRLNAFVPERIAHIEDLYLVLVTQAEARHKLQVEELTAGLRDKSISLAESEERESELRQRLRRQLKAADRLCRFLDETNDAAARLRSSARWQIANPIAALKAKLSSRKSRALLGYGHLEKIVSAYRKWRATHPEVAAIDDQIQALISG